MGQNEETFIRNCFRAYYRKWSLNTPDRFTMREYAFFHFGFNGMTRHIGFKRASDMAEYFKHHVPRHAYYSTAYYKNPTLLPMSLKEEGWTGSDLIFDLDADHVDGADKMTYSEQLDWIKKATHRLVHDFLIRDLGFKDIRVNFSGGRGYHVHVGDESVMVLDQQARQQITNYILGAGLLVKNLVNYRSQYLYSGRYEKKITECALYALTSPGWKGRMRRCMGDFIGELLLLSEDEAVERIVAIKEKHNVARRIGDATARAIHRDLKSHLSSGKLIGTSIQETGDLGNLRNTKTGEDLIALCVAILPTHGVPIDAPVTRDTKRLIRYPGTLHGKTGLSVVDIPIEKIEDFDPLTDAVVFGDSPTPILLPSEFKITMNGIAYDLAPGEHTVPLHLAVFLLCRGIATIASDK